MNQLPDIKKVKNIIIMASEKIVIAKELLANNHFKDSASRAYYGVFHFISALLFTKNLSFSSHGLTIGNFNKEFVKNGIFPLDFNKKIEKLYLSRQLGDYDPEAVISKEKAEQLIQIADEIQIKSFEYLSALYNVTLEFWK